jgi:glycosyltransferase involved in cell wall biosynthesis
MDIEVMAFDPAFWLSLAVLIVTAVVLIEVALGAKKIGELRHILPVLGPNPPKVSVIVPALNEADTIEPALRSLLALHYPNLEIIAINDRSTDATPTILERMAREHPRLRVLHISVLPEGWLGKNHALSRGAAIAGGDYLLFTDADVVFEPSALTRAVNYCEQRGVDHLTLLFDVVVKTQLLRMLVLSFSVNFMARFKPWKVATSPKHFLGAGGFNLVRADAYRAMRGHGALPLAVLDDMMLGKRIKAAGYRQHVLFGRELVGVEWYRSARDMINGMQKNIFAAFDFQLGQLIAVTAAMLLLRVWPWIGLVVTEGVTQWINAATVLFGLLLFAGMLHIAGWGYRCLVFAPVISLLELAIWWRGSLTALLRGGIEWRGTRYALDELRRHQD